VARGTLQRVRCSPRSECSSTSVYIAKGALHAPTLKILQLRRYLQRVLLNQYLHRQGCSSRPTLKILQLRRDLQPFCNMTNERRHRFANIQLALASQPVFNSAMLNCYQCSTVWRSLYFAFLLKSIAAVDQYRLCIYSCNLIVHCFNDSRW
jgi:hypothetical protein